MFFVLKGKLEMQFRNSNVEVCENEFSVVPKGIEHRPFAKHEAAKMLFEAATTLNAGNTKGNFTREELRKI